MRHKPETECPYCATVYKMQDFASCPGCEEEPRIGQLSIIEETK